MNEKNITSCSPMQTLLAALHLAAVLFGLVAAVLTL